MASRVLEVAIVGNASQLQATLGKANAQTQAFGDKMAATGKRMQSIGKTLTTHLTLPIVGAGVAAGKMALDFETSMNHVQALTGTSAKQTKQWGDQILAMGKTLPIAPQELAKALYFVASAGVKTSEVMPILKRSAEASAAGMGSAETVAQLLTSAINAYGAKALSAKHATDVLTESVKLGKAEPADLASNLGKVIPIASAMGVKFSEVATSVAELTNTGLSAAEATTAVRATMVGLLKPSSGATKELAKLGFSVKQVQASIAKKGLNFTLGELAKRIGGNRQEMAKLFPNVRALNGFLSLTGKNAGNVRAALDKMAHSTGATDTAFKTAGQSAHFKFQLALAQLQDTAIKLGEVLIPIFQRIVAKVMIGVTWFSNLSKKWQDVILAGLGVAAAIGPIVGLVGTLIVVAKAMMVVTKLWTAAQWLLNAALDGNPIGIMIIAAAALAAGFVILWKRSGTFRDIVKGAWSDIQAATGALVGFIRAHWGAVMGFVESAVRHVWSVVGPVIGFIHDHWKTLIAFIPGIGPILYAVVNHFGTIKTAVGQVVGFIHDRWGNVKTIFSTFAGWVNKYIIGPINAIIKKAQEAIRWLEKLNPFGSASGGGRTRGGRGGASPTNSSMMYAQSRLSSYGWNGSQMSPLVTLWNNESGWSPTIVNTSSGAEGIPQFLPMPGRATPSGFPTTPPINAASQINWGLGYIASRYGSPGAALSAWESRSPHWYDNGGVVPGPRGQHHLAYVAGGETILPTHKGGGYGPTINIYMPPGLVVGSKQDIARVIREGIVLALRTNGPNAFVPTVGARIS